jgi:hypothetical protein
MTMKFEWDEAKRLANIEKHGVDFLDAAMMLCDMPWLEEDSRRNYGETRCRAAGIHGGRLLVVAFTPREGAFRIISARWANARERRKYADQIS